MLNIGSHEGDFEFKVCILVRLFPPMFDGAGIAALHLSRRLVQKGITVSVLTSGTDDLPREDRVEGIQVYRIPAPNNGRLSQLRYGISIARHLWKKRSHYDILHMFGVLHMFGISSFLALPVCRFLGKRTIVRTTLLGSDDAISIKRIGRLARMRFAMLKLADAFVSISSALTQANRSSGLPEEKLWEIPNGVDTQQFAPVATEYEKRLLREKLSIPVDRPVATFVGAIVRRKGIDLLVEAWKKVAVIQPCSVLVLVGPESGDEVEGFGHSESLFVAQIKSLINKHRLSDRIIFAGRSAEVQNFLKASDIFIFPSRREGFPKAPIEAMACGLPVIMAKLEGISDNIISNGHDGIIVSAEDSNALADALLDLLLDADKRHVLGRQAREKIVREFSIERITDAYIELYRYVLREGFTHKGTSHGRGKV